MADQVTAKSILEILLSRGEVARERSRDVTLPASLIKGYPFRNADQLAAFHEGLRLAERQGAISLEWQRYYEGSQLVRIRLRDAPSLARFLGRAYLPDRLNDVFEGIDSEGLQPWVISLLEDIRGRWLSGKSSHGLKVEDADKLLGLVNAIRALEDCSREEPLDYRQFGARYLGDSKLTRILAAPLAAIYRSRLGLKDFEVTEILAQLNLVPLAQPVLLRGPIVLSDGRQRLNAGIRPHVGAPVQLLHEFELSHSPEYVLTIENQSSFNEYTAAIQDQGVIVYTAGFPTRALQGFYRRLVSVVNVPLYHWGDSDVGGFRILKCLQQAAQGREVQPHLMEGEGGTPYSKTQLSGLEWMLPINSAVDALLNRLIARGAGAVEQENTVARRVPID